MLNNLSNKFGGIIKTLKGQSRITESNIQDALKEVRLALLDADVALPVVKTFMEDVKEKALGQEVIGSLSPGQAFIGVVNTALTELMGGANEKLDLAKVPPAVVLMAGLQGAGKTTSLGKLARLLKKDMRKKVAMVSCDVYRPAAIEQLRTLSEQVGAYFIESTCDEKPADIAKRALEEAKLGYFDVLLVDTAGRTSIDELMMVEIAQLHKTLDPVETLFVVDSMLGQDAVNTAKAFNDALPLTGVILTKMDGDARGGAALSVRHVTGKPIKFIGVGEKLDGLEPFHPDRLASRILGMGDVLTLIEDVKKGIDQDTAEKMARKLNRGKSFDLNDFLLQIKQLSQMGGVESIMSKMPGNIGKMAEQLPQGMAEKAVKKFEAIILSMTPKERAKPIILKASRKKRIAQGAGVTVQDVNAMLKQFDQAQKMLKQFSRGGMGKLVKMANSMRGVLGK